MAIGMACALLIFLWVYDEWSCDRHFKNANNLYRLVENENPSGGEVSRLAATPAALANALKEEYPEIIRSSRYDIPPGLIFQKGDEFIAKAVAFIDKDFLKMFDIEFVRGDISSALNGSRNIVITKEIADTYFHNEDPIGKTLTLTGANLILTITGVVNRPHNSHLRFDLLIPIEFLSRELGVTRNEWDWRTYNYIELKKGTDSKIVDTKIRDFVKKHKKGSNSEILLQNVKRIHLFSSRKYNYDISGHGDIIYVRILSLIAVFILLIACINFMNLSTAQSAIRAKEIGVRKVAGAKRRKIIVQFLGESLLIVFMAHIIAMILVELLLPSFNNLTGKRLDINYQNAGLYVGLITVVLFCGLLAGSYPAFYLSSLKPLDTIKGVNNKNPGNAQFRRGLVIFQFSLSVILIICTLIVGKQLKYMQNKNLGFNKDNIGYFRFDTFPGDPKLETIKRELSNNPDIVSITKARYNPFNIDIANNPDKFTWAGKKEGDDALFYVLPADVDYAKTFQLELKEGRFFSSEFSIDNAAVVINETAAKVLGFKNPVGEILSIYKSDFSIIGVVKDFHFKSLHYKIGPLIMQLGAANTFFIRMKSDHITSAVGFVMKTYKSFNPPFPIDFHFLDDDFVNQYQTEQRMNKIFGYFSLLAIIISCLGLIGLSSFMTERRTKEIGIRKANGAKSIEIFSLLSGEYAIWVSISIIIACPIAWYAMHKWLQNYAYRISISWWVFALAGAIALLIALLTVSVQSYKAASKNPVEALRYE
jgi:putative ABC transport system permease protein